MKTQKDMDQAIKEYWEDPNTRSIIDKNLHKIEADTVCSHLKPSDFLIDIGCGNGIATAEYAKKVKKVLAIERSGHLRSQAVENAQKAGVKNIVHESGDVLELGIKAAEADAVVTQRMLINLSSWEDQQRGLDNIARILKPKGRYIMIENTNEAFRNLNTMKAALGQKPVEQHWHNLFFDHGKLKAFMEKKFTLVKEYDFSLYYFLTRVYTQMFASFEGYGIHAKKDSLFEISDQAARSAYEKFNEQIRFKDSISVIQGFVFERR